MIASATGSSNWSFLMNASVRALMTRSTPAASAAWRSAADVVGVLGHRAQPAALGVDGVLDVEADRAGLEQPLDELGGGGAVAGLHVGGDRDVGHGGADAAYAVEGVVERHVLVVALAARVGERVAADAQRREAGVGDGAGRPGVPDVGQDQRGAGVVEVEQGGGAGGDVHAPEAATHGGHGHRVRDRSDVPPVWTVLDSVVIGAGQAGLAASYFLRQRGIDHVVLDANPHPGGAWQHRWASLSMDDVHGVADLPGVGRTGRLAARGQRRGARLLRRLRARAGAARWCVRCGSTASRATATCSSCGPASARGGRGPWSTRPAPGPVRSCPYYPGIATFAGEQVHTAHYPGAEHFRGKRVLVVGGGASAVQFLGELAPVDGHAVGDPPAAGVARRVRRRPPGSRR